ncbi:ESX secretion-associated protein EspG [Actinosynnema pretiosum subsp. pretiosum]|uniref:ESX secretion-associated protein EspG n=2 Tax=Actinosynnema TaxID=40566 RepID=C6WHS4_ACTMD|nr:ESX secretion-associated protein EspG [Actinosynnema mirum]ACU40023.1 hypothetical protein Amir_6218 [Actinosynnema mirum DSM 43827]AXX33548.1 hypothetical protein APASM_6183 [Actinosynnema pretiosum subsp. pretiosum]QUF02654.1 ESX secretion-associated protein EspG [Actinosynnema pretiosum subsp. pretiosum]
MIEPEYLLTPRQLDVLWQDLGLGRLPYPLDVPSLGATEAERARLREQVLAELGGQPDHRLVSLLRLLADHRVSVDAIAHVERPIRAVAVSDGDRAALAVIDSGSVGLLEIRPTSLARSIVEVLPAGAAGPGSSLSLRVETMSAAVAMQGQSDGDEDDPWGDSEVDERTALQRAGLSREDATALSELAANRKAGGQFGVSHGGGGGYRAQRAGVTITWFDTHQGRYLMVRENGWLSLAPTDNDRIASRIDSVLAGVA